MIPSKFKIGMPGFIVTILLAYFGLAIFQPWGIKVDDGSPLVQTLINLTIAAASYFIGTSQGSARKDDVIAGMPAQPVAPAPPPPADPGTTTKE